MLTELTARYVGRNSPGIWDGDVQSTYRFQMCRGYGSAESVYRHTVSQVESHPVLSADCLPTRYDLFESQVSYAYSRARTRGRESHLIHMLQRGNDTHRRILTNITQLSRAMHNWVEIIANGPEGAVPPTTLYETHDPYLSESEDEGEPDSYIKDPTTSGRIRLQDATGVVYQVAASMQSGLTEDLDDQPLFHYTETTTERGTYPRVICTVTLPKGPTIRKFSGSPSSSFSQARRIACYETCSALFHSGLLDYQFFPQPRHAPRHHPDESNPLDPEGSGNGVSLPPKGSSHNKMNGTRCYPRKRPDFWPNSLGAKPTRLYPTVISVEISSSAASAGRHGPIVMFTRMPLPSIASFKLFNAAIASYAHLRRGAAIDVDNERLEDLHRYTIRICRSMMNKAFVCPLERMPYFFAPINTSWPGFSESEDDRWHRQDIVKHVPWEQVSLAARECVVPLKMESVEALSTDLEDGILQDRWVEFTRRHFVVRVRSDLTPLSKPTDSAVCISAQPRLRASAEWDPDILFHHSGKRDTLILSSTAKNTDETSRVFGTMTNR